MLPRYSAADALTVSVELKDFSVYYSQGLIESISAELKAGKGEVVCEAGWLIKVSRTKNGVMTRNILSTEWTDWVYYSAMDFDYESRKEIVHRPKNFGVEVEISGIADSTQFVELEEHWTWHYIFENGGVSARSRGLVRDRFLKRDCQ